LGAGGLVAAGSAVIAGAFALLASVRSLPLLYGAMLLAGLAWISVLSMLNASAQTAIPSWVRARALSAYLLVFFAGVALGSVFWGLVADRFGIGGAYLVAASGLVAGLPVALRHRLRSLEGSDLSPSLHWPAPQVATEIAPDRGPVLVTVEYAIDPARAPEFREVMRTLRRIRLRDGALLWDLFVDSADPGRHTEAFVVESWAEHLRQHERVTVADRELETQAHAFHLGEAPPRVTHHLAAR
ncbi:MAG: MFS transporter, partial [Planctomycetota bacterium]